VTTISETKDLTTLITVALFGKLRERELEMTRLNEMESAEKKSRSLALKSKVAEIETSEESSEEDSDSEDISLLTKQFQKYIKLKRKGENQQSKRYTRKPDLNPNKLTYYGCGKQGHMKTDCPNLANKEKSIKKKNYKAGKGRKAYVAWKDNASSSSSSSQEDNEGNPCFMAGKDSEVSSEDSSTSVNSTNYNLLLDVFQETHEVAEKLARSKNRLKGKNNWLKARVKELEDEVLRLETDLDHYKTSSNLDSSKPTKCENCEGLQKKVNYLINTASKLTMGTANLNVILGSQNCVLEKAGIGHQPNFPRKQKKYSSFFETNTKQFSQPITCFYCMKRGHSVKDCKFRRFLVPKGLVRWVPKSTSNTAGPKFNRVPMPQF